MLHFVVTKQQMDTNDREDNAAAPGTP